MILKFLVYFFLVFQVREAFSASTPILLMVEDGAYFEPLLYSIRSKDQVLFFLGVNYAEYPLEVYHPFIYRLIFSSDALLFEYLNQDFMKSLQKHYDEYKDLGMDVWKERSNIKREENASFEAQLRSDSSFEEKIRIIAKKKYPEISIFGLDDPDTLFKIYKLIKTSLTDIPRSDIEKIEVQTLFMLGDSQGLYNAEYNYKNTGIENVVTEEQVLEVLENNKFLLDQRNQLWYDTIKELMRLPSMQEATFFGLVGFSHLLLENRLSLPNIFKHMGFKVQRITNKQLDELEQLNQK